MSSHILLFVLPFAKLGRNENVNTDILLKICVALKCDIEDILEIVPDESE